jgi:hypothetical protein
MWFKVVLTEQGELVSCDEVPDRDEEGNRVEYRHADGERLLEEETTTCGGK